MASTTARSLCTAAGLTMVLAACGGGSVEPAAEPPAEISINAMATDDSETTEPSAMTDIDSAGLDDPAVANPDLRQRCIDGIRVLDRRWEEENFEYADEGPELTEEELEQMMAPLHEYEDGVAGPGDRPTLSLMGEFDPETIPIPQLDRFRETCFEQGVVSEAELYGDDDGGSGSGDGEEDWCRELAALPIDEVREFAAEDGDAVVREEFEACGLPNPLGS